MLGLGLSIPAIVVRGRSGLVLDFASGGPLPIPVAASRAAPGYALNAAGVWVPFAANTLRRTDLGLVVEPASTNETPNSAAGGSAAGSPGTLPTGWTGAASANGLVRTVVGSGVEDGLDYVDIQFAGTATANGTISLLLEPITSIPAVLGQTWCGSVFTRVSAGTLSGFTNRLILNERNSAGTSLASTAQTFIPRTTGLGLGRQDVSRTLNQATTAYVVHSFAMDYLTGAVINATFRIAAPQLSRSAVARTPIRTTGAAATSDADLDTMTVPAGYSIVTYTFDDGSKDTRAVSAGAYQVPLDLPRATIPRAELA